MSSKKRGKKSGTRRRTRTARSVPFLWLLQLAIILVLMAAGYLLWLDHRITTEFEGRRWSLPALVYSRPYDLYIGRPLNRSGLERELQALNYRQVAALDGRGQYHAGSNRLDINPRPFTYWDGKAPPDTIRVEFEDGHISNITDNRTGGLLAVTRLEPTLIGKIYPRQNEDRVLVRYDNVPQFLKDAIVAVEDRHFFAHPGVDLRGMARALLADIRAGALVQGGSTLTQQLVKNFFFSRERSFVRKVNEILMALLLERRYSKREILAAYINEVYLGQNGARGIHGFGTAAEFYFGKPLDELAPEQLALLVGLVRGASYYNPRSHPGRALARRNLVLREMAEQGYLDHERARRLQSRPPGLGRERGWSQTPYPAYLDLVRRELLRDYRMEDLRSKGLRIFTTLDPVRQEAVQDAVRRRLGQLEQQHNLPQGQLETAALVVDVSNGEVEALIGGRHDMIESFNRALEARRPIGSLIKPFIYLTALNQPDSYNLLSRLDDSTVTVLEPDGKKWRPDNYEHEEHGPVTLLEALTRSYNLATVRLGMQLGVDKIVATLHAAGLEEDIDPYPSLLLGSLELTPLQVAQIYQTLANGGYRAPLKAIRDVLDRDGQPLQRKQLEVQQALPPDADFLTEYLLTKVVADGTGRELHNDFPDGLHLAGKTGTTNDSRDSWFAGFDDRYLAVTWLGRDDDKPTPFTGAGGAMQLWAAIMQQGHPRSLKLVDSDHIDWTRAVAVHYGGACLPLDAVPYIKGHPPGTGMLCGGSPFNPMEWFR